jgi:hypothetical protein
MFAALLLMLHTPDTLLFFSISISSASSQAVVEACHFISSVRKARTTQPRLREQIRLIADKQAETGK